MSRLLEIADGGLVRAADLDDLKAELGIGVTTHDAMLQRFLDGAQAAAEEACGRFIVRRAVTETWQVDEPLGETGPFLAVPDVSALDLADMTWRESPAASPQAVSGANEPAYLSGELYRSATARSWPWEASGSSGYPYIVEIGYTAGLVASTANLADRPALALREAIYAAARDRFRGQSAAESRAELQAAAALFALPGRPRST